MNARLLGWVLCAGPWLAAPAAQEPGGDGRAPGEPRAIAGLDGLRTVSRLVYAEKPDLPHRMETVYAFPDRCRWYVNIEGGPPAQRLVEYRFGDRALLILPRTGASSELEGPERDDALRRMELRRAVLLWPDGFAWNADDDAPDQRSCRVPRSADAADVDPPLGHLVATLGEGGHPSEVRLLRPDGREQERLRIGDWHTSHGRTWPAELELAFGSRRIWNETIESFQTQVHFLDLYFLPPDRRGNAWSAPLDPGVSSLDLIGITYRSEPLREGIDWPGALARAEELMERTARELGTGHLELDRRPTFELSPEGRPVACVLRLARVTHPPPEGWTTLEDRPGLLTRVGSLEAMGPGLRALYRAVPASGRGGVPYLRVYAGQGGARYQVALPLLAGR